MTGRTADRPRSGRPRVTTANEDRHLHILHLHNRFLTVTLSTGLGHVISRHTVCRRLRQHGIGAYRRFQRDDIDEATSTLTFRLGTSVSTLATSEMAACTFFSVESRFQLFIADDRIRIYRRAGGRTAPSCVQETTVWWWICDGLERYVWPTADRLYYLTAHRYLHIVTYTLLKHVLCGQMYSPLL